MNGNRSVKLKICREMEKNFEGFNKKRVVLSIILTGVLFLISGCRRPYS